MENMQTISGIRPDDKGNKPIPFSITTAEAEEYLQKRFDSITNLMRKNGIEQDDIKVMLVTVKCSKKFMPMLIMLPDSVIADNGKRKNKNVNEASIFNPDNDHSGSVVRLKTQFLNFVKPFVYNSDDEKTFFSSTFRNEVGLSAQTARTLKNNRLPKIQKVNNGKQRYVIFLIDPIRLFHHMVTKKDNQNERFYIRMTEIHHIKDNEYKYKFDKVYKNKNKNNNNRADKQFQNAILRQFR